jgi:hypothetical protein
MAGGNKHPSPSQSSRPPPVFSGDIKSFSKISLDAARAIVRATPMPSADGIHFCFFSRINTVRIHLRIALSQRRSRGRTYSNTM